MSKKLSRKTFIIVSSMALSLLVTAPTFAETLGDGGSNKISHNSSDRTSIPGVFGTVASISGTTITVTGKNSTTYSVEAASAKILKDKNTMNLTDIKIGDMVMVKGKITGNQVVATVIQDGFPVARGKSHGQFPGITGIVTAENGTTLTITSENGTTYSVDASNASFTKGTINKKPVAVSISDVQTGDTIMVMGTVNGTSVQAEKIFDGKFKAKVLRK